MDKIGIAGKAVYTLMTLCYGRFQVDRYLKYINNWENSNEKVRKSIQDRQFLKMVRYAYRHVPFYRNLYSDAGVDMNAINDIQDIGKLPIVHKEQLRNAALKSIRPPLWIKPLAAKVSTTGSSGAPFSFYRSKETLFINGAQLFTYLDHWGLSGERKIYFLLHFVDPTLCINLPSRNSYSIFNKRHSVNPDQPIEKIIQIIEADKPDCLLTYPSTLEDLTDYLRERNQKINQAIVFATGGEMLTNRLKNKLNRVFTNHGIYDLYNAMEMGMMAYETPDHNGLHINDYAVVIEKGEKIMDAGGECYFKPIMTNLWNFATPLIRYDGIDDLLQFAEDQSAFAGGKETINGIHGRKSERIIDRKNHAISACVLMTALADLKEVSRFQFVQSTPGEICFRYIPSPTCHHSRVQTVVSGVFQHLFVDSMNLSFEQVDHIERIGVFGKYPILVRE